MKTINSTWGCLLVTLFVLTFVNPAKVEAKPNWEKRVDQVISEAKKHLNKQYKYGTNGPDTFDCSGFTQYVWKQSIHYKLNRTSKEQAKQGKNIPIQKIKKGDLLFFKTSGDQISHVAIYMGDDKMIHAASEKSDVEIQSIENSYWKPRLIQAQRIVD